MIRAIIKKPDGENVKDFTVLLSRLPKVDDVIYVEGYGRASVKAFHKAGMNNKDHILFHFYQAPNIGKVSYPMPYTVFGAN